MLYSIRRTPGTAENEGHGLNKYGDGLGCLPHILHVIKTRCLTILEVSQNLCWRRAVRRDHRQLHTSQFHSQIPRNTHHAGPTLSRLTCSLNISSASLLQASYTRNFTHILRSKSFPTCNPLWVLWPKVSALPLEKLQLLIFSTIIRGKTIKFANSP